MGDIQYHVVLEGRKVGPYERRTIIGMRIKKTLTSDHVLLGSDGTQLTVADLIGQGPGSDNFNASRTGNFSLVQATYSAGLVECEGKGLEIPNFRGELEARVQADVLRLAGRFRQGLGWKEDRVKIPLRDIAHVRVQGSQVELGVRAAGPGGDLQRIALELFGTDAAAEFAGWLPAATPWPQTVAIPAARGPAASNHHMLWVSMASLVVVVGLVLAVLYFRRLV